MRNVLLVILLWLVCQCTFANLPFFPITFPRDEAAHYKNIPYSYTELMEWWYFNGKVTTDEGRHFGFDIAVFHPAIVDKTVITKPIIHLQIADLDQKKSYGSANDYPVNTGNISTAKLSIKIKNDYSLEKKIVNNKEVYVLKAQGQQEGTSLAFDLILDPESKPFLINQNGLIQLANDTNSYYYSIPHFKTAGTIKINNNTYQIKQNSGDAWMDHQWGDFNFPANGWEWFSIRLENGLVANIFLIIDNMSKQVIDGLANVILPSGEKRYISYHEFFVTRENEWFDKKLSISYPQTFNISIPSLDLELKNVASFPEQEIHGYWEGHCDVTALYQQQKVSGFSYTEIVYHNPNAKLFLPH